LSTRFHKDSTQFSDTRPDVRAVFMGTPVFVIPVLDSLVLNPAVNVVAAYVPPDRPSGRGRALESAPVKHRAVEHAIPVIQPSTLRNRDAVDQLAAMSPDLIVVAAYGRLLPKDVLNLPRFGCLNLHPSVLPRHRGPSPVVGSILAGDDVTGVSLMLLEEGMDTGPVIAQRMRPIQPDDDAESLTAALFADGADLLAESLFDWFDGRIAATPQDDGQATYTEKVQRADGAADWQLPAIDLYRRLRAYTPWPGLYTDWNGKGVKLLSADATTGPSMEPGLVASADGSDIYVGTGNGLLKVLALQIEGRRPASAADFLRGYPKFVGARLGNASPE
jgi:methionyl-tRNA formyltransferase